MQYCRQVQGTGPVPLHMRLLRGNGIPWQVLFIFSIKKDPSLQGTATLTACKGSCILILTEAQAPVCLKSFMLQEFISLCSHF